MLPTKARLKRLEQRAGIGAHAPLAVQWHPADPVPEGRRVIAVHWIEAPPTEWVAPKPKPRIVPRPPAADTTPSPLQYAAAARTPEARAPYAVPERPETFSDMGAALRAFVDSL